MALDFGFGNTADMKGPSMPLRLGAVAFAVLWTLWMLSWSGSFDRIDAVTLSICGAVVGYAWYRAMRWQFQRKGLSLQVHDAADLNRDR
jgi:hypothetical protein